ncbi:hypothetical protein B0H19DRAFT_1073237 [Mycena capillaripes]|nr:hypothetical protein B0H19DRAFT_1073237 [Mycena capillaripes]
MVFNGEFAFGSQIVQMQEEIAEGVFFLRTLSGTVISLRSFINKGFRGDYHTRLPEQNYGYAGTYQRSCSITTFSRQDSNAHRPHCTSRRKEEDVVRQEEEAEVISAQTKKQWGMLTPAVSLVNLLTQE